MLLAAIRVILCGQSSLLGTERLTQPQRKTLNELISTQIGKPPSDWTFRLLLAQFDVLFQ